MSKEEGIAEEQWCYLPNEKGAYAEGMKVKANVLSLSGYRLPTEAEWEYACRARSVTAWSMGEAEDLLGKYAWFIDNSPSRSRPAGSLRPNDLGLFDVYGNVWELCQNRLEAFTDINDPQKEDIVNGQGSRSMRGGALLYGPLNVRSSHRGRTVPAARIVVMGFRPARTFP